MFFVNMNDFHYFETVNESSFQSQLISEFFSLTILVCSISFARTLFQSMTLINLSQIESSRGSKSGLFGGQPSLSIIDGKLSRHHSSIK